MKKIDLFPLSVFSFPLGFPDDGKTDARGEWIARILEMRRESAPPRSEISAWTGDVKGHASLHAQPLFVPLFSAIARGLTAYLAEMSIDPAQFDLYVTRSWGVVAEKNERVNRHAHLQSHLSVAYYLQTPSEGGRLAFLMPDAPNEFLPGLFESRMGSLFKGPRTAANSSTTLVDVEEGDLVVFPSKTVHATEPHHSDEPRISISATLSSPSKRRPPTSSAFRACPTGRRSTIDRSPLASTAGSLESLLRTGMPADDYVCRNATVVH